MAERTPYLRASYDAVLTTPRPPTPPTTTGFPRSEGLSRCSTEAKKASRSRCITEASRRMAATYPSAGTPCGSRPAGCGAQARHGSSGPQAVRTRKATGTTHQEPRLMPTTLTARGPEDLLAAVPVVLGFRPQDALVLLTFGPQQTFHARLDLPSTAGAQETAEIVEVLLAPCRRHDVDRVAFVIYSADAALAFSLA